jgi:hypothetical protein
MTGLLVITQTLRWLLLLVPRLVRRKARWLSEPHDQQAAEARVRWG